MSAPVKLTEAQRTYRISARGFAPIEKTATSLRDALNMVHPNVKANFEFAQVSQRDGRGWTWCCEAAR